MAELIVVRHATTIWTGRRYCGRSDPPLDSPGIVAAERLAPELLPGLPNVVRLISSPKRRALMTAEVIARSHGSMSVEVDDRWAEVDFGMAEGLTFEQLHGRFPDIARAVAAGEVAIDWPGGETMASFGARVRSAWQELAGRGEATLVVTHGGPMRLAIALATCRAATSVPFPGPGSVWRYDVLPEGRQASLTRTA